MPTILIKKSDTASAVPGTANLTNLAGGAEVAVNTADRRMFTMNSSSAVVELGTNPSSLTCADVSATVLRAGSATITNLLATTLTISSGTANGVLYLNGSKVATSGSALVFDGTNLGLGVTPSAWGGRGLDMPGNAAFAGSSAVGTMCTFNAFHNGTNWIYKASTAARAFVMDSANHIWYTAGSGTAGGTISFTQAMTLDASGRLGIGTTSPDEVLVVKTSAGNVKSSALNSGVKWVGTNSANNAEAEFGLQGNPLVFLTNGSERARITSGGDLLVGKTTQDAAISGCELRAAGLGVFTATDNNPLVVNRRASDGTLVLFRQDNADEGSISVSGNTVSYNAFAGSHWSQLQDGSKPDILRGTVMESINELCVWPGEENERLPKSKVSDTAGSKKVYGVFMAWDNDWTETNDMYVTAVGAFICRVNGSVTVEEGDLLESNGDGTARVQADDIIRSSTIGKVTSTVKTHEYDDGSYCVPTVLYCG